MTYRLTIIGESRAQLENNETWKVVSGWVKYEVSSLGRVRSWGHSRGVRKTPRLLKQHMRGRYLAVGLGTYNSLHGHKFVSVHRLVAEAFHGPCPDGFQCAHINGNALDNRAVNLQWSSCSENNLDKVKHGTMIQGEKHRDAKLTSEQVLVIRESQSGQCELARRYGVTQATIWRILNRWTWKHV